MKGRIGSIICILCIGLMVSACETPYERMVREELASGVRNDSLFLGIKLGMERDSFYNHCWELNKQGIVREGPSNSSVRYTVEDLPEKIILNFYPDFQAGSNKMNTMHSTAYYDLWAPWLKKYSADSLLPDMVRLMEMWYGEGFIKVERENKGQVFVKVDGNRRILIHKIDDRFVKVTFTDLLAKES